MRFYVRKRKQAPAVIIVALIDILIVLVIFLMVTTTFKQQSAALKVSLPESTQAKRTGAQESPPLVVTIDTKGNLRLGPEAKPVTVDELKTDLAAELAKRPDLKLAINGDEGAPWGKIMKVLDVAHALGIKAVNALAKEQPASH
jgi:biopolymer transport protein ExbD